MFDAPTEIATDSAPGFSPELSAAPPLSPEMDDAVGALSRSSAALAVVGEGARVEEISSYGPHSKLVRNMAESHRNGRPIGLYEIMQGMHTYGRMHTPPPRIIFVHKDGERVEFNGYNTPPVDLLEAVEFENHGPGLAPEDLVINDHDENGVDDIDSLGEHGHGTTIALAYFASQGWDVTVSSNYNGEIWSAQTGLKPSQRKQKDLLHATGASRPIRDGEVQKTTFRFGNPTAELLDDIRRVPSMFLYANPRYCDATIVRPDANIGGLADTPHLSIESGEVQCLHGVIPEAEEYETMFIDGLAAPLHRRRTILPWHAHGLKDASNTYHQLRRSTDSTGIDGSPDEVIPLVVRTLTDRALLKKIIDVAVKTRRRDYVELQCPRWEEVMLSEETRAIVADIWLTDYDDALIEHDETYYARDDGMVEGQPCRLVSKSLFDFLRQANVKSAESARVASRAKLDHLRALKVPNAKHPSALDKIMDSVAQSMGEADVVHIEGKDYLRLKLPHAVTNADEFNGVTISNSGKLIRIIGIVLAVQEIEHRMFSIDEAGQHVQINMSVQAGYYWDKDSYETEVVMDTYPAGHFEQYRSFETGATYVLLSAEGLNLCSMHADDSAEKGTPLTRMEALLERFLIATQGIRQRLGLARKLRGGSAEGVPEMGYTHTTYESIPTTGKDMEGRDKNVVLVRSGLGKGAMLTPGFYRREVAGGFSYAGGNAEWKNESQWHRVTVKKTIHKKRQHRTVETDAVGDCRLAIPVGHTIVGYQVTPSNANIMFFRDVRNDLWETVGDFERLEVYSVPSDTPGRQPSVEEMESPIVSIHMDSLDRKWQRVRASVEQGERLTVAEKTALISREWSERFKTGDPTLSVGGSSAAECAINAVNTCAGDDYSFSTGLAILLRTVGIPSRIARGIVIGEDELITEQTWVEYHDGTTWHPIACRTWLNFTEDDLPLLIERGNYHDDDDVDDLVVVEETVDRYQSRRKVEDDDDDDEPYVPMTQTEALAAVKRVAAFQRRGGQRRQQPTVSEIDEMTRALMALQQQIADAKEAKEAAEQEVERVQRSMRQRTYRTPGFVKGSIRALMWLALIGLTGIVGHDEIAGDRTVSTATYDLLESLGAIEIPEITFPDWSFGQDIERDAEEDPCSCTCID